MKKTILIAGMSFLAGLILAAFIFVYNPGGRDSQSQALETPGSELSTRLYASTSQLSGANVDIATIAERLGPAVVGIEAEVVTRRRSISSSEDPFDDFWERFFGTPRGREQEYRSRQGGTGFFISEDGYILTNNHIVENAVSVKVTLNDGEEHPAKVIGTDPETDLALVKIDAENMPFAKLGNSETLRVGEWVVAIGNPLGLTHTVTAGIVSAKGRLLRGLENLVYQDFIQTDAAINRGNSGGPLINLSGEVIGINSVIYAPSGGNIGIGFAISASVARNVSEHLRKNGRVIRGYIGITGGDVDDAMQKLLKLDSRKGAYINRVVEDLPAEKAGLKRYDVVIAVDGNPVEDLNDLFFKIAALDPGEKAKFTIMRDGKRMDVEIRPQERESQSESTPEAESGDELGIRVQEMTAQLARRYGFQTEDGLLIREITPNSEAARQGLQVGDIILEANRRETNSVKDLEKILDSTDSGEAIVLLVRRESRRSGESNDFIITLRIPE